MDAIDLLINGTVTAFGLILRSKDIDPLAHVDDGTAATKAVLKENISALIAEWKEAVEGQLNEAWLRELVNAQCNQMALKVVERIGL
jgi:hypothetical protein